MAKSVRDAMTENPRSSAHRRRWSRPRTMREAHIGSLPITDDEQLVGMITDRDITTRVVAEAADPKMTPVGTSALGTSSGLRPTKTMKRRSN